MPRMWAGRGARASRRCAVLVAIASASAGALGGCGHAGERAAGAHVAIGHGDGPDGIVMVREAQGAHVVVNQHPVHMTLELDGVDIGVSEDDPNVWVVDGQIIQVAVVPPQAIYGATGASVSNAQLLLDHLAWESGYVASELGTTVRALPRECRTARGTACLVSRYDLLAKRRSLLVTTVVNDQVVALASIVPSTRDSAAAEARLRAVLETISPRDAWIDPAAEALRIQRRSEP
jgi:hypothetical protein